MEEVSALVKLHRKHKSALTRARNTGDPALILQAATKAFNELAEAGHEKHAGMFKEARIDAEDQLRKQGNFNDRRGEPRGM